MCYVVVTARSLLWLLVSLIAFLMVLSGVLTPKWLIGPEKTKATFNSTEVFTPTVGIYNRCTQIGHRIQCGPFAFDGFATEDVVYPACWKAALFFLALGLAILCCTLAFGVLGCCLQAVCKKSIFSLAGAAQSLAGVCCVFGMVLYPWGWGAQRVQRLCGADAQPYFPAECTLGWAFIAASGGVVLTFISSVLSSCADRAANSDKVQFEMDEGKHLICLA